MVSYAKGIPDQFRDILQSPAFYLHSLKKEGAAVFRLRDEKVAPLMVARTVAFKLEEVELKRDVDASSEEDFPSPQTQKHYKRVQNHYRVLAKGRTEQLRLDAETQTYHSLSGATDDGESEEEEEEEEKSSYHVDDVGVEFITMRPPDSNSNSFLRITNVKNRFLPESEITLTITPLELRRLTELGIASGQALSSQIIGAIGAYRHHVLRDQECYGFRTDLFREKEIICQEAFSDIYTLQALERAHGATKAEVVIQLKQLNERIDRQIKSITATLRTQCSDRERKIYEERLAYLSQTYRIIAIKKATLETGHYTAEEPLNDFVEAILYDRFNAILERSIHLNELFTIGGKLSLFRGKLHGALCRAKKICTNYIFDQDQPIRHEHQSDYTEKRGFEYVTVMCSRVTSHSKEDQQRFLLASSYILNRTIYDAFDLDNPEVASDTQIRRSRGWTRLFRHSAVSPYRLVGNYYQYFVDSCDYASINMFKIAYADLGDLWHASVSAVSRTLSSGATAIWHAFKSLYHDFFPKRTSPTRLYVEREGEGLIESSDDKIKRALEAKDGELQVREVGENEFNVLNSVRWSRMNETQKWRYFNAIMDKKIKQHLIITKSNSGDSLLIDVLQGKRNSEYAPLVMPPTDLHPYVPNDPLSAIAGGVESFFQFFDNVYEENPSTGLYCLSMYMAAGITAIRPEWVKAFGAKHNISSITDFFIAWHYGTAAGISAQEASRFIAAAMSAWQETLVALQALSAGDDSVLADITHYLKNHFPKAIGAMCAATGIGYLVTDGVVVPYLTEALEKDAGSYPFFEKFFTGLKLGVVGYETFESDIRHRSIVGTVIAGVCAWAILPVRIALIPVSFLWNRIQNTYYDGQFSLWKLFTAEPLGIKYVIEPLHFAAHQSAYGLLHLTLFVARILLLACRFVRLICKMAFEWFFNNLALTLKFVGLNTFIGHAMASWVLGVKVAIINLVHDHLSGPLKQKFRILRNAISRFNTNYEKYLPLPTTDLPERKNAFAHLNIAAPPPAMQKESEMPNRHLSASIMLTGSTECHTGDSGGYTPTV